MDFSLIENHPIATGATVLIGGAVVFLFLRRGGSQPAAASGTQMIYGASDPNATAANAAITNSQIAANVQISQLSAQLQGLGIQSQTQIQLAQIDALTKRQQTDAAVNVTNRQTDAELALGMTTQQAAIEQSRINAGLQSKILDTLLAAFGVKTGGGSGATTPPPTTIGGGTNPNNPGAGTVVNLPPGSGYFGGFSGGLEPGAAPVAGGQQLIPFPNFAQCSPLDPGCVRSNQTLSDQYGVNLDRAQNVNNYNQCVANAANGRTQAERDSLIASCHAAYGV